MRRRTPFIVGLLGAIALVFGTGAPSCAPSLRAPYIQNVTETSAVIVWKTKDDTDGSVDYGPTTAYGQSASSQRGKRHEVTLTGLQPDTEYYYRVLSDGRTVAGQVRFRTAKTVGQSQFDFVVFGDSGQWSPFFVQMAERIEDEALAGVDLIIHTGDVVYPDGEEDKYDVHCFSQYKRFLASVPMFPSMGNHDVKAANGQAYLDNWSLPLNNVGDERWYAFGWGNVRFLSISTEESFAPGSPQYQFVESQLATAAAAGYDWVIPYFHKAPFNEGRHGDNDDVKRDLVPLFEQYDASASLGVITFSGHDHNYQRTVPINGVTHVLTGGGGQLLYPVSSSNRMAKVAFAWHLVRATVDGKSITLTAIDINGNVIDQATITQ